ncbi:MAG: hypothetical protein ABIM54_00895 [candidate division WOR-3 bacterium]
MKKNTKKITVEKIYKKFVPDGGYMVYYMEKDGNYYRKRNFNTNFWGGYAWGTWNEIDEETFKRGIRNAELIDN